MKNIFKILFVFIAASVLMVSCEEEETNFAKLTMEPDANAGYYVQFKNASKDLETAVDNDGNLVDIETTIDVALMGMPLSQDLNIPLKVEGETTMGADMYTLSATSVTIPAGKSSGSVTVKSVVDKMPVAEQKKLVLSVDAGANNAPTGTKLTYDMYRIEYCMTVLEDIVGEWGGTDSWDYKTEVVTSLEDGKFIINGLGFGWFQDWWGEVIVTNTPLVMDVNTVTGTFEIAEQPYIVSTWNGDPQPAYGLSASGKIDACNKVLTIDYQFHQGGEPIDGTAWGPKFKEVITLK